MVFKDQLSTNRRMQFDHHFTTRESRSGTVQQTAGGTTAQCSKLNYEITKP